MTRIRAIALSILVASALLLSAVAANQSAGQSQPSPATGDKRQGRSTNQPAYSPSLSPSPAATKTPTPVAVGTPETNQSGSDSEDWEDTLRKRIWPPRWETFFPPIWSNWALAIFAGIAAGVALRTVWSIERQTEDNLLGIRANVRTAKAAEEAAKIARDSLEISQRAQVSIENVRLGFGSRWVDYELVNSGKQPATGVAIGYFIGTNPEIIIPRPEMYYRSPDPLFGLVLAAGEAVPQRYPSLRDVRESNGPQDSAFGLAGLQEAVAKACGEALTPDSKVYLQFAILIAYWDGFGKERQSWRWFLYDPALSEFKPFGSRQD